MVVCNWALQLLDIRQNSRFTRSRSGCFFTRISSGDNFGRSSRRLVDCRRNDFLSTASRHFFQVRTGLGLFKLLLLSIVVENLLRRVLLYALPSIFPEIGQDAFHHFSDYWFFSQLPVFVGGLLACRLFDFLRSIGPSDRDRWLLAGGSLLLVAFMSVSTYRNLIKNELLYGAVFALMVPILCLYPVPGVLGQIFKSFGKFSYSLYLMHGLGIMLLRRWLEPYDFRSAGMALSWRHLLRWWV